VGECVELQTARLVLRPFSPSEEEAYYQIGSDPRIQPQIDGVTDRRRLPGSYALMTRGLQRDGYGLLAVTLRDSGQVIGLGGLIGCDFSPDVQALVAIREPWEGNGYGTEATARIVRWAFDDLERSSVLALVREGNGGSLRILAKLSAIPRGESPSQPFSGPRMFMYQFIPCRTTA